MEQQIGVIIVAGGGGTRMGGSRPKQFMMLGGLPVLAHTINNFAGALPGAEEDEGPVNESDPPTHG